MEGLQAKRKKKPKQSFKIDEMINRKEKNICTYQRVEFQVFLLVNCILVLQGITLFSQVLSCVLWFILCLILWKCGLNKRRCRMYLLVLCISWLGMARSVTSLEDFQKTVKEQDLPEEPHLFTGVVIDDVEGRRRGIAAYTIRGIFNFYPHKVKIRVMLPDAPWRPESEIKIGDTVQCAIPVPETIREDFLSKLRELWSGLKLHVHIPKERHKEYSCTIQHSSRGKVRFAEKVFSEIAEEGMVSRVGSGVLLASTMGRGEYLEGWIRDLFKETGLYHLLVVSGYHLGVLVFLVGIFLTKIINVYPQMLGYCSKSMFVILGVWIATLCFLFIGTMKPPLIRASLMMFVFTIAKLCERDSNIVRSILYSLLVIIIWMPLAVFHPGVQFSYAALTGVLFGLFVLQKISNRSTHIAVSLPGKEKKNNKKDSYFFQLCASSTGACLFTWPLQWYWFSSFTPYAVLFNILFVPVFSFLVVGVGITLVFLTLLGLPGMKTLLVYHSVLIELIVESIALLYDYFTGK
jgi:ComEC/Rec2-related protein